MKILNKILLLFITLTVISCSDSSSGPDKVYDPTFTNVQNEIFNKTCAVSGCHATADPLSGNLNLSASAYDRIVNQTSASGVHTLVIPGDSEGSYLYQRIITNQMPASGSPLPQNLKNLVKEWIDAGAENN